MTHRPVRLLLTSLLFGASIALAQNQAPPTPVQVDAAEYVRFVQDAPGVAGAPVAEAGGDARLETAVGRFAHPDGYEIDLVAVVHFADAEYFDKMNSLLGTYDCVLYEMVGGPFKAEVKPDPATTPKIQLHESDDPMAALQKALRSISLDKINLEYQKTGIDYTPENFVHADATWDQFTKFKADRGEDILGMVMKFVNMQKTGDMPEFFTDGEANELMTRAMAAFTRGDGRGMKLALGEVLGNADAITQALEGEDGSAIISDRNVVALDKAFDQVARGKRRLCLFYGAAHMEDFEERLLAKGFEKKTHRWETAWNIPHSDEPAEESSPINVVRDVLLDEDFILSLLRKVKEGL